MQYLSSIKNRLMLALMAVTMFAFSNPAAAAFFEYDEQTGAWSVDASLVILVVIGIFVAIVSGCLSLWVGQIGLKFARKIINSFATGT